jgi:sigma-B regulation protein RsbU (phosphoserine phosphatase)
MSLRLRLTILVMALTLALSAVFALLYWRHDEDMTARYHETLLQAHALAWRNLQAEAASRLVREANALSTNKEWLQAWRARDGAALGHSLSTGTGLRLDLFGPARNLVYTSSADLVEKPLVEAARVVAAQASDQGTVALTPLSHSQQYLVVTQGFSYSGERGVLALGLSLAKLLPAWAQAVTGEAVLLNTRGGVVAATQDKPLGGLPLPAFSRQARVTGIAGPDGTHWLAVQQPLADGDSRPIGALVALHDVTREYRADQKLRWLALALTGIFVAALGVAVFIYLRQALAPLERSVGVLDGLSQGDLREAPTEDDQELRSEAGQIARSVARLRAEMFSLGMLRDERVRIRHQQERVIREQLLRLAANLDEEGQREISEALAAARPGGDANQLVELARVLGRISSLVTTQHKRLVDALHELSEAMKHQAQLVSLQQELEIARRMQASILPRTAPPTERAEVASLMIPAKEIGGDFYDYFLIDSDHLAFVTADVSGKGVPAAFFMAVSRTLLKSYAAIWRDPAKTIEHLNDQLCADNEQMMFVTAFFGVLNLSSGVIDYVNAGHNPPLLLRQGEDAHYLPRGQNVALAVMEEIPFRASRVQLAPQDALVLYTDGITEASTRECTLFGEDRLLRCVNEGADRPMELPQEILGRVREFEAGAPQADDITCVVLRYRGA